jgi:hypothetical protein
LDETTPESDVHNSFLKDHFFLKIIIGAMLEQEQSQKANKFRMECCSVDLIPINISEIFKANLVTHIAEFP